MDYYTRVAKVEDNKDPKASGRVKVRIYPEFSSLNEQELPWASPATTTDSFIPDQDVRSFRIPEKGSYVLVKINPTWQEFFYTGEAPRNALENTYSNIVDKLTESVSCDTTSPQPLILTRTKDGVISYHNTDTGELGLVSKEGVYVTFNSSGDFVFGKKDGSEVKLTASGEFVFKGKVNSPESSFALYEPLKEVLEKLLNHIHIAPNGPTQPAQEASGVPLSTLKQKIIEMESK